MEHLSDRKYKRQKIIQQPKNNSMKTTGYFD